MQVTEFDPHSLLVGVARANDVPLSVIRGPRRDAWATSIRRQAARVLREAGLSLPAIGRMLGGRHHTTVMGLLEPSMSHEKHKRRCMGVIHGAR